MSKRYGSPDQRFDAFYIPEPNSGCWLWLGRLNHGGYAQFWNGVRREQAHRWSYQKLVGPIPEGLQIDHLCRVRSCVNPAHLEAVTQRENTMRGIGTSAQNARKTTCPKGHPFTAKWGHSRRCRDCHNAYRRQWEAERKAEGTGQSPRALAEKAQTHCIRGHEFTQENTTVSPQGWRTCRECDRQRSRRKRAAKRSAV